MNHQIGVVGELALDDLQQVAGSVESDRDDLGWVGLKCRSALSSEMLALVQYLMIGVV